MKIIQIKQGNICEVEFNQIFEDYLEQKIINIYVINMEPDNKTNFNHQTFLLQLKKDLPPIKVRSNFDSGNLAKAEIGLNNSIVLTPSNDCAGTQFESHAKGWFYFGISGLPIYAKQKFIVKKMNSMGIQTKFSDYFKPVYRYAEEDWSRLDQAIIFNKDEQNQLHFQIQVEKVTELFFAFTFPFSFEDCEKMLSMYKTASKLFKNIYYHDQILTKSPLGRPIHLLTITSNDYKTSVRQPPVSEKLFPQSSNRPYRFSNDKKIIIVTARVHPSEAPGSHTMNGLVNFLLSKDARADILRKNFVFKIVPMLNPDGVFLGHHRMDCFGKNLNRFYLDPDPFKQPSAYALRKLGQFYKLDDRLCFYIDLHAHPQKKGNFIYGNAFDSQDDQVQTQLFPKILSLNCIEFDYENSCFSKNHMSLKDKNEDLSKEGCGRVVFNRNLGQIYAYTVECGYTCSNYLNDLSPLTNAHRKYEKLGIIHDDLDNIKSSYYSNKKVCYFTIRSYHNLGKSILISILDLFEKNPYSRIANTIYKDIGGIKGVINQQLTKSNKDFKIYASKMAPNLSLKKPIQFEKKKNNRSSILGKSVPRRTFRTDKNRKSTKNIEGNRRQTLPKMKTHKI